MRLLFFEKDIKEGIYTYLGGGNSNIFGFHPKPWGNNPIDGAHMFQMGWFNFNQHRSAIEGHEKLRFRDEKVSQLTT